jgi:hypothetical protein
MVAKSARNNETTGRDGVAGMSVVEAERSVDERVNTVRREILEYLKSEGKVTLQAVLEHLAAQKETDEILSRALSSLLTSGQIVLTSRRELQLAH